MRGTTFPVNFPPTIQTNKKESPFPTFDVIQNEKWLNTAQPNHRNVYFGRFIIFPMLVIFMARLIVNSQNEQFPYFYYVVL